jgi:hypothetical protein
MTPTKPSANEKRLAKLLREMDYKSPLDTWSRAAFLARRGVLAVCAATLTDDDARRVSGYYHPEAHLRPALRRLARGAR